MLRMLRASTRSSLRLSLLSKAALISSPSLLNHNVLGRRQPPAVAASTQMDNSLSMLPSLLAAGAFAAVLLPTSEFLGRPATSAGVERMFSKAGKLHDDMKKGQEDDTLEHSLFAVRRSQHRVRRGEGRVGGEGGEGAEGANSQGS